MLRFYKILCFDHPSPHPLIHVKTISPSFTSILPCGKQVTIGGIGVTGISEEIEVGTISLKGLVKPDQ